jgi:hypothetical protein
MVPKQTAVPMEHVVRPKITVRNAARILGLVPLR